MSDAWSDEARRRALAAAQEAGDADEALVLGRYRLVRELGRGGMGVVHEAFDVELSRRVALKRLAPLLAGEAANERFLREARAAARLRHPNVARVLDAAPDVLVLEFVDGAPLQPAAGHDVRRVARWIRDAAHGVHHAHEHGVIHRDVKPGNLLLEGERVVVTDFGLARDLREDARLSRSGEMLGTPATMAPEQARGRPQDADARTDVWGLGATLYELCAGRAPFTAGDVPSLLRRVVEDEPPPLRSLRPDVPRDLERIVRQCLEKEPARRYPTAAALADDLDRFLGGRPVTARRGTLGYRAVRFVGRHRAVAAAAAVATLLLVTVSASALYERARRQSAAAALALAERVGARLEDAALHDRHGDVEARDERLRAGVEDCRAFLAEHDVAHAWFLLGRLLRAMGDEPGAREALDSALRAEPALAEARLERGLLEAGDSDRARDDLRAALDSGRLRRLDRLHAEGELARLEGRLAAARVAYEEVLRLDPLRRSARHARLEIALAEGDDEIAWALAMSAVDLHRGFGPAYVARAASAPAGAAARSPADPASAVWRAVGQHAFEDADRRARGPGAADALHERAAARLALADVEGALADVSAALALEPTDALAFGNRALVHARRAAELGVTGDAGGALAAWEAAIADASNALRVDPHLAGALNNRAVARLERARLLLARHELGAAAAERRAAIADLDAAVAHEPRFALARVNRAVAKRAEAAALAAAARIDAAEATLRSALADVGAVIEEHRGSNEGGAMLERALVLGAMHRLLPETGHAPAARAAFDAAAEADPRSPRARGLRALFLDEVGERAAARAEADAALALAPEPSLRHRLETLVR